MSEESTTLDAPGPAPETHGVLAAKLRRKYSYVDILKSSALIAGSSVINLALNMVRTKIVAILLGPTGIGLLSMYGSIAEVARSIAGLGIASSGVRQIAEAAGSGDHQRLARTGTALRRVALALGILGAIVLLLFSTQVAKISFGTQEHVKAVALLSLALLFNIYSDARGALLQGTRRIPELVKMGVLSAALGAACSTFLIVIFGEQGIAPSIVAVAGATALVSRWYCGSSHIQTVTMSRQELTAEIAALLKLGSVFMVSTFLVIGASYAARVFVHDELGISAAGLYQAAWALGGLYVGIILQAMGTDFYPRLVAVATDNDECNRLVNEQARVSLLLAGPGILATLVLAPWFLSILYSSGFTDAVDVLRWTCFGIGLRIISWPMGFIIVAKGRRLLLLGTDVAWALFNVGGTWLALRWFGLVGAGIALFASYVLHIAIVYPLVRHLSGFRFSSSNRYMAMLFVGCAAVVMSGYYYLSPLLANLLGGFVLAASSFYTLYSVVNLIPPDRLPANVRALARAMKFMKAPHREGDKHVF